MVYCTGQVKKELPVVTVRLGKIVGNHMEGDKIIKPIVHPDEIIADPHIVPDSPGVQILDYKCSIMTSMNEYWGPFVKEGSTLDEKILDKIRNEKFIKGRIFLENIHVRYKGLELMANNIIVEFVR